MADTVTLRCGAGHDWERPASRGRRPRLCPEHGGNPIPTGEAHEVDPDAPRFSEEEIAQDAVMEATGIENPTFAELVKHANKYGPDGILESAHHFSEEDYAKLKATVDRIPAAKVVRRRKAAY